MPSSATSPKRRREARPRGPADAPPSGPGTRYTNRNPAAFQPLMPFKRALLLTNPSSMFFAA